MGYYPSDIKSQLTKKFFFAFINLDPSNDRREHRMMIAQLDKIYYFAISLGRRDQLTPF